MQLCSLHHCVLFFILTFTLAPVSAQVIFPTRGKLHQPVTLSCTSTCSSLLIWNLYEKRSVHLAQCNRTSCWAAEGFSISHDKYLRGDFSLTITKADYSKRNVYACECGDSDYAIVRLIIETVFTPVQMKYDEDLKLKVSVPEPVEVIYKRGDAADEVICNVTNGSLQCKDKYRDRTSLTYPELTLRHVTPRDKATYTIRNIEYNDDIQIYAVSVEAVFIPVQTKSDEDLKLKVSVPEPVEVIYKSDDAADEVICNVTKDSLQCKDDYRHRTSLTYPELTVKHMTPRDSGSYTIRDTKNNEDIQIYDVFVEEKPGFPAWGIVLILILSCCCVGAGIVLLYERRMRKQLERRQQLVDQLVQEALGGTEEKIREAETSLDQLQQQYNIVYKDKVKVFCSDKREQLLKNRLQQVNKLVKEALVGTKEIREAETSVKQLQQQYNTTVYIDIVELFCSDKRQQLFEGHLKQVDLLVQEALGGTEEKEEKIREVEETLKQLQQKYNNTVYELQVTAFYRDKRRQLLKWRQQQVDLLVQEALGGTEEKIREVEKSLDQLQQQYNITVYKDQVKEFCSEKRRQLLKSQLLPLVQPLKKHEEWKKEDTENLERKLRWLMSLYRKSEHLNDVSLFCMEQRSQISWNRLQYSKEEPFVTKRSELNRKLLHVEQLVQQAEAGTEEKILEAKKAIDELELQYSDTEYSNHVSVLCDVKRTQLNPLYSNEGLIPPDRELYYPEKHVEKFVQQAKGGTEEIRTAEEKISELELDYFTTKYSRHVSLFCMTMRAELYWHRLHSDNK